MFSKGFARQTDHRKNIKYRFWLSLRLLKISEINKITDQLVAK